MQTEIATWLDRAAADRRLAALASGLDLLLVVVCDGQAHGLKLSDVPRRVPADATAAGTDVLHIAGSAAAFAAVLTSRPEPWFHSFGAWLRHDTGLTITADPLAQAQALAAMERLVELARPEVPFAGFDHPQAPEAVIGRRRRLAGPGGRDCLIHWLEAGQETRMPIVFLHTAGADARQYLYQLGDSGLQRQFRMLAFDMPWHGHSGGEDDAALPEGYRLSEAVYGGWVTSFIEQVVEEPVILIGCSMGAAIALAVTAQRPDLVRGCIALEAPLRAPGRRSSFLADARIAGGQHNAAYVRAMLSPAAPQRFRDAAAAIYSQALPGVYLGDLWFYSEEYDGARLAAALRVGDRPIELLTGSYDYSASPANTRALHAMIDRPGVGFAEMPELGHFPMIEDPVRFRPHLMAALGRIGAAG